MPIGHSVPEASGAERKPPPPVYASFGSGTIPSPAAGRDSDRKPTAGPKEGRIVKYIWVAAGTLACWVVLVSLQAVVQWWILSKGPGQHGWITLPDKGQWETLANAGESFGPLNSLVSAVGLGLVAYSIILQMRQLRYHKEELKNTQRELHEATEAQKASARALTEQIVALRMTGRIDGLGAILRSCDAREALLEQTKFASRSQGDKAGARRAEDALVKVIANREKAERDMDEAFAALENLPNPAIAP